MEDFAAVAINEGLQDDDDMLFKSGQRPTGLVC